MLQQFIQTLINYCGKSQAKEYGSDSFVRWGTFFITVLFCSSLASQGAIAGKVLADDGSALPYAQVSLHLPALPDVLYKGILTDSLGEFLLSKLYLSDSVMIRVSCIGFGKYERIIEPPSGGDTLQVVVNLLNKGEDLPVATVTESYVKFTIRGDTVAFNPVAYLKGNEKTLGDLIENIPELELSANGDIKFRGKQVDAVLVEGLDILNGRQRSATEDFGIEHIRSIEVIENYKGAGDFLFGETEKVVVNVRLEEDSKRKWIGKYEVSGGPPKYFKGDIGGTRATDIGGFNIKLTGNSVGESALSPRDYLNFTNSLDDLFPVNTGMFTYEDLLPPGIVPTVDLQENTEGLLSLGYQRIRGQKVGVNVGIVGMLSDRKNHRSFEQFTLNDSESRVSGEESGDNNQHFLFAKIKLQQNRPEKDSSSNVTLVLDLNQNGFSIARNQVEEQGGKPYLFQSDNFNRDLSGRLFWRAKPMLGMEHKVGLNISNILKTGTHLISSEEGVDFGGGSALRNNVDQDWQRKENRINARWTSRLMKSRWGLVLKAEAERLYMDFIAQSSEMGDFLSQELMADQRIITGEAKLSYAIKPYKFTFLNKIGKRNRKIGAAINAGLMEYRHAFFFERRANPLDLLVFQAYSKGEAASSLFSMSNALTLTEDARRLDVNNADPFVLSRSKGFSLSYFNRNVFKERLTIIFTSDYNWQPEGQLAISIPRGDFFFRSFVALQKANSFTSSIQLIIPINKELQFSSQGQLSSINQQASQRVLGLGLTTLGQSFRLKIRSVKKVDFTLLSHVNTTRQTVGQEVFKLFDYGFGFSSIYNHNQWGISINTQRQFVKAGTLSSFNYVLGGRIAYQLEDKKWEFFIQGKNLTQLVPGVQTTAETFSNRSIQYQYTNFPGFVLFGVERLL